MLEKLANRESRTTMGDSERIPAKMITACVLAVAKD